MRLIRTTPPIELEEFPENEVTKLEYAILSHRWEENEVSFQEMLEPTNATRKKKGYKKIEKFCKRALNEDFKYAWVDTCCINKESSAELSEAINSMFRWYRDAAKCYAFLADVDPRSREDFVLSVWFTRGWTLQELIAPRKLVFLANDWSEIGPRHVLAPEISQTTTIDKSLLLGQKSLYEFSIAKRMSWAAERETTRAEDRAYSLMGIFRVYMPLLYGEGDNAFTRLQEEIMKDSNDETLFAWERDGVSEDNPCGLLAPSPDCFFKSAEIVPYRLSQGGLPFTLTNRGIRMDSPLIPPSSTTTTLILQCIANSALVGIGIQLNRNSAADEFVRITGTLIRDIPPCLLESSVLETTYIPKSVMATSTQIPNSQGRDNFATSEIGNDPRYSNLFHRKIKPRGNFKRMILLFDDDPNLSYPNTNLGALQQMVVRADGSQITYYDSWKYKCDPLKIANDGFEFLRDNYEPGDEITLFGFGRACYPLLELFDMNEVHLRASIRFMGFFDAVQPWSESVPWLTARVGLASCVVRHAIGVDEKQILLKPILADDHFTKSPGFQAIWFSGGHQDIGGSAKGTCYHAASNIPLFWMVNEAEKIGLHFDSNLKRSFGDSRLDFDIPLFNLDYKECSTSLKDLLNRRERGASGFGFGFKIMALHSELEFGQGWRPGHVLKQRLRNLFFSKTLSQSTAQRRGQRQIPPDAIIHYSVMRQMRAYSTYRPSNLCIQEPSSLYVLDERDEIIEYALWKQLNDERR